MKGDETRLARTIYKASSLLYIVFNYEREKLEAVVLIIHLCGAISPETGRCRRRRRRSRCRPTLFCLIYPGRKERRRERESSAAMKKETGV